MPSPHPLGPIFDIAPGLDRAVNDLMRQADRRYELYRAMLDGLIGGPPRVIVIEDAHWADEATINLLRYLGRRIGRTRCLLLVTYRDDEVGATHPLQSLLGNLSNRDEVTRIAVERLSREAVGLLSRGSAIDYDALYRQTNGNAFYVTEVIAAATLAIPVSIRDAVITRAARLSPQGRALLELSSVIGNRIEPWLLRGLVADASDALDESLAIGLLQVTGDRVQFRHQLAEEAIRQSISPLRLASLHGDVLAGLRSHTSTVADVARLAHHAEAAGDVEATVQYATLAAKAAVDLCAHREAEAQFMRALRYVPSDQHEVRKPLLEGWLLESVNLGHSEGTFAATDELLAIAQGCGDWRERARWLGWQAVVLVRTGRNAESNLRAQESMAALDGSEPEEIHAFVYQNQAKLSMLNRDYEDAITWGERAMTLATAQGDTRTLVGALNAVGSCRLLIEGSEESGRADLARGLALARANDLDADAASLITNLGSGHGEIYRFDLAEQYLLEGIAFAQERDLDRWAWYMTAWLALVRMYQGRWNEAADLATRVSTTSGTDPIARIMALVALGRVRARRGEPGVWESLDEALALAIPTNTLQRLAPVAAARAEAAWLAGDPKRAAAEARTQYELACANRHPWHVGELAYWQWKAGELVSIPEAAASPFALQMTGRVEEAAVAWTDLGCPYEAGRALAESDDDVDLRAAFASFDRLGAAPAAGGVTSALRERGVVSVPRGARAGTRSNREGLTPREMDVLALMADGMTNEGIAGRLFLSAKTIEHHASAIYAKLGVSGRAAAACAAHERQLLQSLPK